MTTNVYVASYDDLSQRSVNAPTLLEAVTSLAALTPNEPTLLQRRITNIALPPEPVPPVQATIVCTARAAPPKSIDEQPFVLPSACVVRPERANAAAGTSIALYAINSTPLEEQTAVFDGWYYTADFDADPATAQPLTTEPTYTFTVPEDAPEDAHYYFTAVWRKKEAAPEEQLVNVTVSAEMANSDPLPASCVVRPEGTVSMSPLRPTMLYAVCTDAEHFQFDSWLDEEGNTLGTEPTMAFTPSPQENAAPPITVRALFSTK